jgi:hypothetical protein
VASKSQQPVKKRLPTHSVCDKATKCGPVAQDAHAMTLPFGVAPRDQRTGILQRMAQVPGEQ